MHYLNESVQWVLIGVLGAYALSRAGGPTIQAVKEIGYRVWDDLKSLASKVKFW